MNLYKTFVLVALASTTVGGQCVTPYNKGFDTTPIANSNTDSGAKGQNVLSIKSDIIKLFRQENGHDSHNHTLKAIYVTPTAICGITSMTPVYDANTILLKLRLRHAINIRAPSEKHITTRQPVI